MNITNAVGTTLETNIGPLEIIKFLGKGKSGYSYLAVNNSSKYVVKFMHYEKCEYYSFGDSNKVELEVSAYNVLLETGINIPKLLDTNIEGNYIVKEYIHGDLVTDLIIDNSLQDECIKQVLEMSEILMSHSLNIDYFPDNFVFSNNILYYIDFEHNPYSSEWDLYNWGLYYWANSNGMKANKNSKNPLYINECASGGKPIKKPYIGRVNNWIKQYK